VFFALARREKIMRNIFKAFSVVAILALSGAGNIATAADDHRSDDHASMVVVFKDGHRQNIDVAAVARIDLKAPGAIIFKDGRPSVPAADLTRIEFEDRSGAIVPGRGHFLGKWQVGEGNGNTFNFTLESDGTARKSIGPPHGTWTVENGEARISWDDGWHDAIRKVGAKYEKRAYEPGKSFDDTPSNVTAARHTEAKPI
jgi:hypothetical protein